MRRHSNTANDLKTNGDWAKIGRKKYQHVSGEVVEFDGNMWVANGMRWSALWVAIHEVERIAELQTVSASDAREAQQERDDIESAAWFAAHPGHE